MERERESEFKRKNFSREFVMSHFSFYAIFGVLNVDFDQYRLNWLFVVRFSWVQIENIVPAVCTNENSEYSIWWCFMFAAIWICVQVFVQEVSAHRKLWHCKIYLRQKVDIPHRVYADERAKKRKREKSIHTFIDACMFERINHSHKMWNISFCIATEFFIIFHKLMVARALCWCSSGVACERGFDCLLLMLG